MATVSSSRPSLLSRYAKDGGSKDVKAGITNGSLCGSDWGGAVGRNRITEVKRDCDECSENEEDQ